MDSQAETQHAVPVWTRDQLLEALVTEFPNDNEDDEYLRVWRVVQRWLDRGDGCAVYENHDLGSRELGARQFVSYGSPAAQLETAEPPVQMPDIRRAINWRYQLVAVCKD